jgi:hypothetical protein
MWGRILEHGPTADQHLKFRRTPKPVALYRRLRSIGRAPYQPTVIWRSWCRPRRSHPVDSGPRPRPMRPESESGGSACSGLGLVRSSIDFPLCRAYHSSGARSPPAIGLRVLSLQALRGTWGGSSSSGSSAGAFALPGLRCTLERVHTYIACLHGAVLGRCYRRRARGNSVGLSVP